MRRRVPLAAFAFGAALFASAPTVAAEERDAPAPTRATVRLPASVDFTLANGMRVFLVPDHEVPVLGLEIRLAGGSIEDPAGREGAVDLLASLLRKGAGSRDARAFQEAVDFVGGTFSTAATRRWIEVHAEFLSRDRDLALELVSDALLRPRLDAEEFAKERGLAIDSLTAARQEPNEVIGRYFYSWLFRGHPFARVPTGDEVSLAALTLDDVKAAAQRALAPSRAWLAVSGDFDPAEMRRALEARFGAWKGDTAAPPEVARPKAAAAPRVLLVDKPDALQTYFRFGNIGIDWSHPDYPARHLANTILGGRFTSRLNRVLRTESGLTYGAASGFDDALLGPFQIRTYTQTDRSAKTFETALRVHAEFVKGGITQEELDSARTYIQGQYAPDTVETADQAAHMILSLAFDGLSGDVVDKLFERLDALTPAEVNRVIRERFPSAPLVWVVIGRAETLRPLVAAYGEITEVPLTAPGFGPK